MAQFGGPWRGQRSSLFFLGRSCSRSGKCTSKKDQYQSLTQCVYICGSPGNAHDSHKILRFYRVFGFSGGSTDTIVSAFCLVGTGTSTIRRHGGCSGIQALHWTPIRAANALWHVRRCAILTVPFVSTNRTPGEPQARRSAWPDWSSHNL